MNRRKFLAQSAALAAAGSLPLAGIAQETMRARLIPGTDEALPVVGLGAPVPFFQPTEAGKDLPKSLVNAMMEMGGKLIDTPAFLRPDVPVLGEILQEMGVTNDLFLTSKITKTDKEEAIALIEILMEALNKHPIDLLMDHNTYNLDTQWSTLKDMKAAGKTRYIGVSLTRNDDYTELNEFMKAEKPDFIMTGYSIFHPMAEETALPLAADLGVAVLVAEAFKADEDGSFFRKVAGKELPDWTAEFDCESWAQFALKYVISNPAVNCVATETNKVHHVIDNMGAGYGRLPDDAMRKRMRDYIHTL